MTDEVIAHPRLGTAILAVQAGVIALGMIVASPIILLYLGGKAVVKALSKP